MSEGASSESAPREITNESIAEALLFAADTPLNAAKIAQILASGKAGDVKKHVAALNEKYERQGAAFRIESVANGYRMLTLPVYHRWLEKLTKSRTDTRLSQAALETLAVVAYKQPALRADIEVIRGVQVGDVLNRLRELNLVKIVGRAEVIGRPMLYGTTRKFLEVFGLASLDDLPKVEALPPPSQQTPTSQPQPDAEPEPQVQADAEDKPEPHPEPQPEPHVDPDVRLIAPEPASPLDEPEQSEQSEQSEMP